MAEQERLRDPAPKKPNYARLRKAYPQIGWYVQGWARGYAELLDRAEWLERQRKARK